MPKHLNVSAAFAGGRLTVSPAPESRDASASTQVSLLGPPVGEVEDLLVRGSRTGVHAGKLVAYSQGDGGSFVPSRPFAEGETVSVSARLQLGQPTGTVPVSWSFTVATKDVPGTGAGSVFPPTGRALHQEFVSRPDLRPPTVTVSAHANTATGDLFLAPYEGHGQYGPMILDEHGELVWFDPLPSGARAGDLRVQSYHGQQVLTWWQDPLVAGGSSDAGGVIANSSYRQIAVVRAGNGYQSDLHEFQLTPENTALVTVYDAVRCDVSALGGPHAGAVADTLFQEIDLATGLVRREWHFLDHVPMSSSHYSGRTATLAAPFDPFHINSVVVEHDGSFLVDARNTWAAYDVDPHTGQVRWQLGGKHSSFKLGPGVATAWQHDAREQPDGAITFFDNGADPRVHPASRAIEVALDPAHRTATLVRSYLHRHAPGGRQPGQRAGARQRRLDGGLGAGGLLLGGRTIRQAAVRRTPAVRVGDLSRLRAALERPPAGAPEPGPAAGPFRRCGRLRELERGHRSGLLAGAGRCHPGHAGAAVERPPDGL